MTSFKTAALNTPVEARTLNNMKALESSLNKNVDLFSKIGASRGKDIIPQWEAAYQEDADLAVRIALWARDVRGGAGERQLFRDILLHLEKQHKTVLTKTKLLVKVPDIGRWDDLLIFTDPDVKSMAFDLIHVALRLGDGLCAKWMPRKGPLANELRNAFGWTPKFYRKRLVELTKVVETAMCAKKWDTINFEHVPSLAMSRYLTTHDRRCTLCGTCTNVRYTNVGCGEWRPNNGSDRILCDRRHSLARSTQRLIPHQEIHRAQSSLAASTDRYHLDWLRY